MGETAYCENDECRVIVFDPTAKEGVAEEDCRNCPGCGRMGRIKGDQD